MLKGLIGKVVGDSNEREIQKLQPIVHSISALESDMERRTEPELRAMTDRLRARLAARETLDDLLVDAFAAVREVAKRTVAMRPFDVQLVGGIVLHQGKVAEMKTGEGKTLVATMPLYLNALLGRGVHLVTVNDYLARRDALWMGAIYHLLGLSIGILQSGADQPAYLYDPDHQRDPYPGLRPVPRKEAYAADITYGTNNEFGFDYLRDNLALSLEQRVQRPLSYAIVDEVDNIFIDEARTPLIISGASGESVEDYSRFATIARKFQPDVHYEMDEKERSVYLTDEGLAVVEEETGIENIYDEANYRYVHYMQQALKAQVLFLEGRDYIRQRKQIILIDQHTGRLMPSRRLSEGLHQAIEAKEGVPIRPRDVTSATITIQNYFRMYQKLAGMSGTAVTEAEEFFKIYHLDVVAIPTNQPVLRADHRDVVYRSEEAKLRAVAREILACHSRGQPVLVGTTSVDMSEHLSRRLTGERLGLAAMSPRVAYALQDADLSRDERASLREIMNESAETMNPTAWRRLARAVGLEPSALSADNLNWIVDYLELPDNPVVHSALERALREGIPHNVLNAKEHTREALIIARAGEPGTITIATNMAGRGVDIKLGGELSDEIMHKAHQTLRSRGLDPFRATPAQMDSAIAEVAPQYAKRRDHVLADGGLHVLGTERHEARRIDNQLRGRSGRQGEPGSSRFYISLEDDLMRRFGRKEMLAKLMEQIGDDFPIEHGLVSKTIERAQTSVEGYNFDIRKHLLEYDDVLNRQRETIYDERLRILRSDDLQAEVWRMLERQVDEYLDKADGRRPDHEQKQQPEGYSGLRLLFMGLDDIVPLILPAPSAAFRGSLTFASHLTAFPPFTISFLADQFAERPLAEVQQALSDLARRAAVGYGEEIRQIVGEIARGTLDKYDERLDRYRALLDEKIDDYHQLAEERGLSVDPRRLLQHLERTYPLKLSMPRVDDHRAGTQAYPDADDLREHWLVEVESGFHQQVCEAFLDRVQIRLPADLRLDHLPPTRLSPVRLAEEMHRVQELAAKQPRGDGTMSVMEAPRGSAEPDTAQVMAFVSTIKETSNLDFGRLDRLVGHVLGDYLDGVIGQYLEAVDAEHGLLRRDLERLRESVNEGAKGKRASQLIGVLRELNNLVHLEIPVLEDALGQAVAHEYDKWAQRQLADMQMEAGRSRLPETTWVATAEYLLASYYTQKQVYDRDHRRRATWMPRLPLSFVAQAQVENMDREALRDTVLASLRSAAEHREQAWGEQELQRWGHLSLADLDVEAYDRLLFFLGEREVGDLRQEAVEDLPPHLYDHLRFILALRQWEERDLCLGDLPQAETLLHQLGQELAQQLLDTPVGKLDDELQQYVASHLRQTGVLDDSAALTSLLEQPIREWDQRTRDEVAAFWGRQFIEGHKSQPLAELGLKPREAITAYLQRQRRFVDEERVQRFLVHQRLSDLPPDMQQAALLHLVRSRLDRMGKRKISNLDVNTRQAITESLQRLGLFTDLARRDGLLAGTLADLEPKVRSGFGLFLARQHLDNRRLSDLADAVRLPLIEQLKQTDALHDPARLEELRARRLIEVDRVLAAQVREELASQLLADLASKTMEELPAEMRRQVHQALDQRNYFVDQEKVTWYERKTLAQLPSETLRGLEQYLGRLRFAELEDTPFRELPPETQTSLLALLDGAGLFSDRAERLRLTQAGALGESPQETRERLVSHLGRQMLVQMRDRRPPDLPAADRTAVWTYLRDQGYFADDFKEELFGYQRLDEFDPETRQAVEASLLHQVNAELDSQSVSEMPAQLQARIQARLSQADYFVDPARLHQVEESSIQGLPLDLRTAVETALGAQLLARLNTVPVSELPAETQDALWLYLDQTGYFVDEKKRSQVLDRRLTDLRSESYDLVVADMAQQLQAEIGDSAISELEDELRQALRESVEALGYFESDEVQANLMAQPLGNLRREELDALAVELGQIQLDTWTDLRLLDLPTNEQEALLTHLQARDWFVDRRRLDQLEAQPLRELDPSIHQELLGLLRREQIERLRRRPLADLNQQHGSMSSERRILRHVLQSQGVVLEESQMRPFRRQQLNELDPGVYEALFQELGRQAIGDWNNTRFQNLAKDQQALLSAYLGRRIMGRIERQVLLHTISHQWIDYLTDIEDLRRGIGLEAYGQRDPLVEYKRRAFELFEELGDNIRRAVVRSLFRQPPAPLGTP